MPITDQDPAYFSFREVRAWSRKDLASNAGITFGGAALGNSLLGPTLPVETEDYGYYDSIYFAFIDFGGIIELATVWIQFNT